MIQARDLGGNIDTIRASSPSRISVGGALLEKLGEWGGREILSARSFCVPAMCVHDTASDVRSATT